GAAVEELLPGAGTGRGGTGRGGVASPAGGGGELERVERVAARDRRDLEEDGARKRHAGALVDELRDRRLAQRRNADRCWIQRLEGLEELVHLRRRLARATADQQRDAALAESARRGREGRGGSAVEPLCVVDRNHQRPLLRDRGEGAGGTGGDRQLVRRESGALLQQQRLLEGVTLGCRQLRQHRLDFAGEQVDERREGQL